MSSFLFFCIFCEPAQRERKGQAGKEAQGQGFFSGLTFVIGWWCSHLRHKDRKIKIT